MGRARPLARLEHRERIASETGRVIDLYRKFDDAERVAAELEIKVGRVRRRLRDAGISIHVLRVERAAEIYTATGSVEQTAQALGLSAATIRRRLEGAVVMKLIDELPAPTRPAVRINIGDGSLPDRAPQRLHPELEAATIALYHELRSLRKVGARLGITQEAVRLRLMNAGYELDRNPRMTLDEELRALALYRHMGSVSAVASEMGRATLTIRHALTRQGIEIKHGAWQRQLREPRLHRRIGEARTMRVLYERLGSEVAVAKLLGCSQTLVSNRLKLIGAAPGRGNHCRARRRELLREEAA